MAVTTITGLKNHSDTLIGGAGGSNFILDSDGTFAAGALARVVGDPGHAGPYLFFSSAGMQFNTDIFVGAPGVHNTLLLGDAPSATYLDFTLQPSGPSLVNIDKIVGGAGNQIVDLTSLRYTYGDVTINGGGGDDVLAGNAGNDHIDGGTGNDYVWGGSGNDILWGESGNDRLAGGDGSDTIYGGAGDDLLEGGAGNDFLGGGAGADILIGGAGNDTIQGGIEAGPVTDTGFDLAYGEDGNDLIIGGLRAIRAFGGDGNDTILGGTANDTLDGGTGSNLLIGGKGADVYDGTHAVGQDSFGVMVDGANVDRILGFNAGQGDHLYARFSDLGLTAAATSATAGATVSLGGGLATITYGTVLNAAGSYDIASISLAGDAVLDVAGGPITATTATATHAQFLFDQSTGDLWFDADGAGSGAAVKIAHLDLATIATATSDVHGHLLSASDFILAAG